MSKRPKQFKGTSKRRTFFDRKVRKVGYSRVLSMTKVVPEDWAYVRIIMMNRTSDAVEVLLEKLMGVEELAQIEASDKEGEQHT